MIALILRSLRQHALSSSITALTVALACGLTMAVFSIQRQTYAAFTGGPVGFDAVLGPRSSQLQLVLNSVFHLDVSPGNIPWKMYESIRRDPRVRLAIPYTVGDNYRGFRIVGTTPEIFADFEYQSGRKLTPQPGGTIFDAERMEAVIGSYVAQKTGLRVGSTFQPMHGVIPGDPDEHQHEELYTVVGVLQPTNSPADRVIWIPMEGIYRMGGHYLRGAGKEYVAEPGVEIPDENLEVSAVMLKLRDAQSGFGLSQSINRQGNEATLAWPIGAVMADWFEKVGWLNRVLELVAYLVVVMSAGAILASLYNTMNERRREFAILRALGAPRRTVFGLVIGEATAIAILGAAAGFAVYAAIFEVAAQVIRRETGVVLDVFASHPALAAVPIAMIVLGAMVGAVPGIKAYRTDVATNLAPQT